MTEEIKYYKEKEYPLKWIPAEEMEETPQQTIDRLKQENKELKEWKDKVVKLFESACRCKYLNEETDICSYTSEKCININKCAYKYQELSDNYRSALEEIREIVMESKPIDEPISQTEFTVRRMDLQTNKLIRVLAKINEALGND